MSEWFDTPWGAIYFVVIEAVTLWHAWTWAKSRNSSDFLDLFFGRLLICQLAAMGFFLILNLTTKALVGLFSNLM